MKNRLNPLLLISIGLVFVASTTHAKNTHLPAKKHTPAPTQKERPSTLKVAVKKQKQEPKQTVKTKNSPAAGTLHKTATPAPAAVSKHIIATVKKSRPSAKPAVPVRKHTVIKKAAAAIITAKRAEAIPDIDHDIEDNIGTANEDSNLIHSLVSASQADEQTISAIEMPVEVPTGQEYFNQLTSTHGMVQSSLYRAGQDAGLSEDLLNQLTGIFAWDIDFANNLGYGDLFTVVYGTNSSGHEEILSAEFVNRGRILTAIRYQDADGNINYYSPEGKTMRKSFLSTPVAYDHISSHFDAHRKHPILNRIRAHKGVDYAARTGTPVKAAGDGLVSFLGNKGGYGQVLILKHGEHYETVYAHLSQFKHDLLEGDSVRQGQIIGYVGQTGLATGPHLHYEFRIDGVHSNPEKVTQDNSSTINRQLLADFKSKAQPLLAQLYQTKARNLYAKNLDKIN